MVKTTKTTAYSGMFHFPPWRLAWLATCCLLVCSVDTRIQVPCDAGYSGPDGGPCAPCAAGEFKTSQGRQRARSAMPTRIRQQPALPSVTVDVIPTSRAQKEDPVYSAPRGQSRIAAGMWNACARAENILDL